MSESEPIQLLLADDHPVVLEGIRRFFDSSGEVQVVAAVPSLTAALPMLTKHKVDVAIMDIQMPGLRGPESIEAICATGAKVILFSLLEEDELVASLVKAGAVGYVSKSRPLEDLLETTLRVHLGERVLSEPLIQLLDQQAPHLQFTPRERDIYTLLANGNTTKEVAFELQLAASTVYTYTNRIRDRLKVGSIAEIVQYAAKWDRLDLE